MKREAVRKRVKSVEVRFSENTVFDDNRVRVTATHPSAVTIVRGYYPFHLYGDRVGDEAHTYRLRSMERLRQVVMVSQSLGTQLEMQWTNGLTARRPEEWK